MSDSRGKDSSFLRKVVKFVSNPNTEWSELDSRPPESSPGAQDRSELQVMIDRKRRNDFVRRQELDLLRRIRQEGLTGDQIREMQRQEGFEAATYQTTEQGALPPAEVRRRIDGIERDMSFEDTEVNTRALPIPRGTGPLSGRPSTVALHETTQQSAISDPTRPGGLGGVRAPVNLPQVDLLFDALPGPGAGSTDTFQNDAVRGVEPNASVRWHPVLEVSPVQTEVAHDPELDHAVMAFASADFAECERALRGLVVEGGVRHKDASTWRTLMDLYRAIGQQQRFESTCAQFVKEFGEAPPNWVSIPRLAMNMEGRRGESADAASKVAAAISEVTRIWKCAVRLDASAVDALRAQVQNTAGQAVIDWSPLHVLDAGGAQALRTLLREWAVSGKQLHWQSVSVLFDLLETAAPAGDHLADPAFWQVRLEALRLLGVQSPYDSAAADFAATYGTTPPEWNAPSRAVGVADAPLTGQLRARPDFAVSTLPDELGRSSVIVELTGQLAGNVIATMSRALSEIGDATSVTLACDRLIRVDLMAAGELLNWVSARRTEGRLVRFTQVHRLVALFFCAMGLDDQAPIELRSA